MDRNALSRAAAVGCVVAASCGTPSPRASTPAPAAAPVAATATGVDTIRASDMRAHVELLASDELGGRETLQPGYEVAADYLAKQFASYGLAPLPGYTSFEVEYVLLQDGYVEDATAVTLTAGKTERRLTLEQDFAPFEFSDSGSTKADVVFAGYGITDKALGYDDYAELNVKGKIVLVLRHSPKEKDDKGPLAGLAEKAAFTVKAMNAQLHGAIGMILVTDPVNHTDADDFRSTGRLSVPPTEEDTARMAARAKVAKAAAPAKGRGKREHREDKPFYAVHVSRESVAPLLGGADLAAWQRSLDAGESRPHDLVLAETIARIEITKIKTPREVKAKDVVAFLPGADPQLANEWVVIGGHYDHLGKYRGEGDTIYNGADDNASGTSAVLELAQAFASRRPRLPRSMVFVGFSGEEKGLLGSYAAVSQGILPPGKVAFMLNLDMIGRNPKDPVEIVGDAYASGVREAIEAANDKVGLALKFGSAYAANSDHHAFFVHDVPMMFFFTGLHDDYHQISDHADKLAYDRMEQIARVAYGVTERIASSADKPRFIHQILWLGAAIQVIENHGVSRAVLTAVDADSRGARAGLAEGDVITRFGEAALDDPRKIGRLFRDLSPGDQVAITVARGDAPITVTLERAKPGYLGIYPSRLDPDLRAKLRLGEDEGVHIRGVSPDGPAAKSGMKEGDILIRISGLPVDDSTLGRDLARIGAGEKVDVVVVRGDQRVKLKLVLGERPGNE